MQPGFFGGDGYRPPQINHPSFGYDLNIMTTILIEWHNTTEARYAGITGQVFSL